MGYRQAVPETVFVYDSPRQFRILSLGNCQSEHHAQLARFAFPDCSADYILVHNANNPERAEAVAAFLDLPSTRYDLVIAFDLKDKWGPISRAALEERYGRERIFYIPNLTFDGLYPDMTSIGVGAHITGPAGNYHSQIAVGAWLAGVDLPATLQLYTGKMFERFGYFTRFGAALDEYRRREGVADFSFGDVMLAQMRDQIGFFTKNHPTPAMFAAFMHELREALVATGRVRSSGVRMDPALVAWSLIDFGSPPIFPEIAEAAGLRHGGGCSYLLPRRGGGFPISLEDFVMGSFQSYDRIGRDAVLEASNASQCLTLVQNVL